MGKVLPAHFPFFSQGHMVCSPFWYLEVSPNSAGGKGISGCRGRKGRGNLGAEKPQVGGGKVQAQRPSSAGKGEGMRIPNRETPPICRSLEQLILVSYCIQWGLLSVRLVEGLRGMKHG